MQALIEIADGTRDRAKTGIDELTNMAADLIPTWVDDLHAWRGYPALGHCSHFEHAGWQKSWPQRALHVWIGTEIQKVLRGKLIKAHKPLMSSAAS